MGFEDEEMHICWKETQVFDTSNSDLMPENQEPQEINQPMPQATEEDQDTIDNDESTKELSTSEETNVGQ